MRLRCAAAAAWVALMSVTVPAAAQEPATEPPAEQEPATEPAAAPEPGAAEPGGEDPTLQQYLDALADQRLLAEETGSVERLRELVRNAEQMYFDGRFHEASILLFEVAESPRFADFVDLEEFRGAEYMLAGALQELGALRTASRYLERILARGSEGRYFRPAFRRFTDVALQSGDPEAAIERLEALDGLDLEALPEDSANELRYLRGRAAYDRGDFEQAEPPLSEITRRSRFYANAQYLRGVIDAEAHDLHAAEEHFCSIATQGDQDTYTFYVDDRFFEVKDLAWLALGRVAHEGGRADDAFYYYFQVPQDSDRVAEALFESAYAMYEGNDYDTAVDLLDQLDAKFPASPFAYEANLLRGYVHLGRCEFEKADNLFQRYQGRFSDTLEQIERVLESPARQARFYQDLLAAERREQRREAEGQDEEGDGEAEAEPQEAPRTVNELLLSMLEVDPVFYRLHQKIRTLDAEAARAGRLANELGALRVRLSGGEQPKAAAEQERYETAAEQLRSDIEAARAVVAGLTEQIDRMRAQDAPDAQLAPLEKQVREIGKRVDGLEKQLEDALAATAESPEPEVQGDDVQALLRRDIAHARRLPARVSTVRAKLVDAANGAALRALRKLRSRLASGMRRARIGRIDAVMGSKRRIEIQIESLAAGRFPPELQDPLKMQGLLRDDEEYWPFEGEKWEDEFQETVPLDEEGEQE